MSACPLCHGDRERREGERWPGHDRACLFRPPRTTPIPAPARQAELPEWIGGPNTTTWRARTVIAADPAVADGVIAGRISAAAAMTMIRKARP